MRANYHKQRKGYNVYQARLYTITDEIVLKTTYIEEQEAKDVLLKYLNDENIGPTFARAVIRRIDPCLKSWIVPWSIDNPSALLVDEDNAAIDKWRITLYDMGDNIIDIKESQSTISEKTAQSMMFSVNAFYAVISCHESESHDRFIISRTYRNKMFNLYVMDYDPEKIKAQQKEPLEVCYARLLQQDREETERINAKRTKLRQDKEY